MNSKEWDLCVCSIRLLFLYCSVIGYIDIDIDDRDVGRQYKLTPLGQAI